MKRFKKIRIIFNLFILLSVFFIILFSLYKIIHSNKENYSSEEKENIFTEIYLHWEKKNYIVPLDNIIISENKKIVPGNYYYLQQSLITNNSSEKCYLGFLKLQSIKKDKFIFSSSTILDKSKLNKYSQLNSYKLYITPFEKEEFLSKEHIIKCQEWTKIINNNGLKMKEIKIKSLIKDNISRKNYKTYSILEKKCLTIPSKNYLKIESDNAAYVYLEFDEIYKKVNLCARLVGSALITFQPIDGSMPYTILGKSIADKKLSKSKKSTPKGFLNEKLLPGWM